MLGLGPEKEKKIFASRYKPLLPSEAELKAELLRELKKHRTGRCRSTGPGKKEDQAMNPALHDNTWIGSGTSLLWDAVVLIRRMTLVWCA
jgi:hypothetical protein